ncbi:iron chelate uptake ABC transporter family permease subunit, partial [Corynebacterium glyciniphilum]
MTTGTTDVPEPPGPTRPRPTVSATANLRRRRLLGLLGLTVLLVVGFLLSLAYGSRVIPNDVLLDALRQLPSALGADRIDNPDLQVIAELRFPRTLIGIVVGAALGVAGALIQGHTRNPLA